MKVTTKGQVTIPQGIREQLGIFPGADVDFSIDGGDIRLTPTKTAQPTGKGLVERMRGRATVKMTTDEILALTRGES
jgi:AbrB family looped-hinge helix DNA binding protein